MENKNLTFRTLTPKPCGAGLTNEVTRQLVDGTAQVSRSVAAVIDQGTNIRRAMREDSAAVRRYLVTDLAFTLRVVDAGTTITRTDELTHAVDALVEEFPAMTLEGFALCFDRIRKGKAGNLYNRLKLPELIQVVQRFEGGEVAEYRERRHQPGRDPHRRASADIPKRVALLLTTEDLQIIDRHSAQHKTQSHAQD